MASEQCPMQRAPLSDFSLLDEGVLADPWALYARLQEEAPVYRMPETGIYVVSRYDDVLAVLRDTATYSNVILAMEALQGDNGRRYQQMLAEKGWAHVHVLHRTDPPKHATHRKLVDRVFTAERVRALVPQVEALAHQLVDRFVDRGACELIKDFALPLPGIILGEQLGLDKHEFARFQSWALAMLATSNEIMSEQRLREVADIELDAQHYLARIFEARRQAPTGDLISDLVHAARDDEEPFTMHELQNLLNQLITGGYETTTSAIAHGLWLLIQHPDQYVKLRENPTLLKRFVEETLRLESPVQGLMRTVTRDTTLAGVALAAGDTVLIRFGAANQDPSKFQCPRRFDIERSNAGSHLAFGGGIHACLGQQLARQEIQTGIKVLLERLENFELDGPMPDPAYVYSLNFRPLKALPIRFTARAA
ncbi:MAG: cytochrome P450 [Gammaproteobacteria bacterium]